jgi:hypothetical protein
MEAKGLQYQYIEVDPYKKPQALLDVNPRGLVPGIRHGDWGCGESTVIVEYVREYILVHCVLLIKYRSTSLSEPIRFYLHWPILSSEQLADSGLITLVHLFPRKCSMR